MNKTLLMTIGTLAILGIGGGSYYYITYQKQKNESITKIANLASEVEPMVQEILDLYQKRYDLLVQWQKLAGSKLPAEIQNPPTFTLKSENDFKSFDEFQMKVTNQLSNLIAMPEIRKRIKELEKIEEQINRKRSKYHSSAFEADDLIQKYNTGQPKVPVFPAEELLRKSQQR